MMDLEAICAQCIRFAHQREHSWAQGYYDARVGLPILAEDMNNASYLSGRIAGLHKARERKKASCQEATKLDLD